MNTTIASHSFGSVTDASIPFVLQYVPEGPPEIQPDEIHCLEVIGSGSFGKVVRGKCRGKEVAIKILHKPVTFSDQKTRDAFQKEVAIMRYVIAGKEANDGEKERRTSVHIELSEVQCPHLKRRSSASWKSNFSALTERKRQQQLAKSVRWDQ